MKHMILIVTLSLFTLANAEEKKPFESKVTGNYDDEAIKDKIMLLAESLGNDYYIKREEATEELISLRQKFKKENQKALTEFLESELKKRMESKDPEVKERAKIILLPITPKDFVFTVIQSLADGGNDIPFEIADPIFAIDTGEWITAKEFSEIWRPKIEMLAFSEDVSRNAIASKLKIQLIPVKKNNKLLENYRLMGVYTPKKGDIYCDASKPKEGNRNPVKYEGVFIYIIRKIERKWTLIAIGG